MTPLGTLKPLPLFELGRGAEDAEPNFVEVAVVIDFGGLLAAEVPKPLGCRAGVAPKESFRRVADWAGADGAPKALDGLGVVEALFPLLELFELLVIRGAGLVGGVLRELAAEVELLFERMLAN